MPLSVTVPLVVCLDYLASLGQGLRNRTDIRWTEIIPLIPFSIAGVIIALIFLSHANAALISRVFGVFIISFAIYTLSGFTPRGGASRGWGVIAGLSGGMIGTLFGTGGPFYVT